VDSWLGPFDCHLCHNKCHGPLRQVHVLTVQFQGFPPITEGLVERFSLARTMHLKNRAVNPVRMARIACVTSAKVITSCNVSSA
jgi:hypothetical protein